MNEGFPTEIAITKKKIKSQTKVDSGFVCFESEVGEGEGRDD